MDPLDMINISGSDIAVSSQAVTLPGDGTPYSVAAANSVAWAKDPFVLSQILQNNIQISVYGLVLTGGSAFEWLQAVASAQIVYS